MRVDWIFEFFLGERTLSSPGGRWNQTDLKSHQKGQKKEPSRLVLKKLAFFPFRVTKNNVRKDFERRRGTCPERKSLTPPFPCTHVHMYVHRATAAGHTAYHVYGQ